jgi:multimeric flavodoxin WrbA
LDADLVIFATPIWWGGQSSLVQRVIERLDEIHDEIMESGKSRLTIKVAGIVYYFHYYYFYFLVLLPI